jgi:archaellin
MKGIAEAGRNVRGGLIWKLAARLAADQSGFNGPQTAVILTVFIIAGSIFAYVLIGFSFSSNEQTEETVHLGLNEASSILGRTSGMIGHGVTAEILATGDTPWTAAKPSAVSSTVARVERKRGAGSAELFVRKAFNTGLVAFENRAGVVDLSDQTQLRLWVRSTTTTAEGQLEIVLDEDPGCESPDAHAFLPALPADDWTLVTAAITLSDGVVSASNSSKDAVTCIGLGIRSDLTTLDDVTIHLDELAGAGEITRLVFDITAPTEGEPIDLAPPVDSDGNGLADPDGGHAFVVSYYDRNQSTRDLFWSAVFLGVDDEDGLLEVGERAEITVFLQGLADGTPLTNDEIFSLELKPAQGSALTLRRITPFTIDPVMTLD